MNWKTPTNYNLLCRFIGMVGYLADEIPNIRLPLNILSAITGDMVSFYWEYTEQWAFKEAKALTQNARDCHCCPIVYRKDAEQVWLVTDSCLTGISDLVS